MPFYDCVLLLISMSLSMASFDFHRPGWLDKVVEYHKNKLFEDFRKVSDVEVKATIETAPEGYVDSPAWDFDSVTRLLALIGESKSALPVRRVLRRMFRNTRRKMTVQESFKVFPSLSKVVPNDLYYDIYSGEMYGDVVTEVGLVEDEDHDVIMVSNPVESRLPSAMISIALLRKILEQRANAARYMPTTAKTIPWKPMTKTTSSTKTAQNVTKQESGTTSTGKTVSSTEKPVDSTGKPVDSTGSSGNKGVNGTSTTPQSNVTTVAAT